MGAWGALAFDNDDACDWAGDLDAVDDFSLVEAAFDTVESAAYLEAPDASNALAACEVVARAAGRGGYQNSYTEGVDAWVEVETAAPLARGQSIAAISERHRAGRAPNARVITGLDAPRLFALLQEKLLSLD